MNKKCFKCGIIKPLSDFYKHKKMGDGYLNKCKACTKKDVQTYYKDTILERKNYEQIRNQKRREYLKKREPASKEQRLNAERRYREKYKIKYCAKIILNNAIRDGKIKKGLCQICSCKNVHGHHYDYTKPLDVIWLCDIHHKKVHWWLRWNSRQVEIKRGIK